MWSSSINQIIKGVFHLFKNRLYSVINFNEENKKAIPKGSIIAGFRRQRNLGEIIIVPSKPKRVAGGRVAAMPVLPHERAHCTNQVHYK